MGTQAALMRAPALGAKDGAGASSQAAVRRGPREQTHERATASRMPAALAAIPVFAPGEGTRGSSSVFPRIALQRKLAIGAVDDPLEREADRVAEQVMRRPAPGVAAAPAFSSGSGIQRACACGGTCSDCRNKHRENGYAHVRTKAAAPASPIGIEAPPIVHAVLRSPGRPLDAATGAFMEARFGWDFSRVRVHSDGAAAQSAEHLNADAYTVGSNVVFGPGRFSPRSHEGRRLIAHELTHVVQQRETAAALQRTPKRAAGQDKKRAAILANAAQATFASVDEELDAQLDAEKVLGLDSKRNKDKAYALRLGQSDKARIEKSGTLSADHQHEITVKIRFFDGEAKAAYLRTITAVVSSAADAEQVLDMLAEPRIRQSREEEAEGLGCDAGQKQFPLLYEGEPENSTCMDITTDREYIDNYFDRNILDADAYSVPGTTWENVDYRSFNSLVVKYQNGSSEYFMLDEVGNFYFGGKTLSISDFFYLKRKTTELVYPIFNGRLYSTEQLTPKLIKYKNGLKYRVKELQDLFTLVKVTNTFASLIGSYSQVEAFRASIEGFKIPRRTGRSKGGGVTEGVAGLGTEGEETAGKVRVPGAEEEGGTARESAPEQKLLSSSQLKGTGKLTSDPVRPALVRRGLAKAGETMYEYKMRSSDADDQAEARMADRLSAEGHDVHFRAADKGGDLIVDGVLTDVKHPRTQNIETAMGAAAQQGANQVVIDGARAGLTDENAHAAIQKFETNAQEHPKLRNLETAFIVLKDGSIYIYHRTTSLKKAH
jgi:hypothetical protein